MAVTGIKDTAASRNLLQRMETAATNAETAEENAEGFADESQSHAVGAGPDGEPAAGSAKSWAQKTSAAVSAGLYSAKEWAVGVLTRGTAGGGSSRDWASYTGGTVDNAEYSAKYRATQASRHRQTAENAAGTDADYDVVDPDDGTTSASGVPGAAKSAADSEASAVRSEEAAEQSEQALVTLLTANSTRQIRDVLGSFDAMGTTGLSAPTETNAAFGFSSPFGPVLGTDPAIASVLVLEYNLAGAASALATSGRASLLFWGTIQGTTALTVDVQVFLGGSALRPGRSAFVNVVNGGVAGFLDNINTSGADTLRITFVLPEGECALPNFVVTPGPYALTEAVFVSKETFEDAIAALSPTYATRSTAFAVSGAAGREVYRVTASVNVTLNASGASPGRTTVLQNASGGVLTLVAGAGVTINSALGLVKVAVGGTAIINWSGSGGTSPFVTGDLTA